MKKCELFIFILLSFFIQNLFGQATIRGTVTDSNTGEALIGCNVYLQGTTIGATTDLDGNFVIRNVPSGNHVIIASYVSYDSKNLEIKIPSSGEIRVNITLSPATIAISEVKVVGKKRQDTEVAMLTTIKSKDIIISGISNQQIQKSQDRDAAEVLRRIPGITITDGRFVVVRGLYERYNSVLLNHVTAPSSEADQRAFSFDLIPSGMIDNIIIYKSPAPELPADFAGSAINVTTKNIPDENSFSFSYTTGYTQNATFHDFLTYKGGNYDWLGIDDGTRKLPSIFPPNNQMNDSLYFNDYLPEIVDSITKISKAFRNDVWIPQHKKAPLNQSVSLSFNRRFKIYNIRASSLTAMMYSNSYSLHNAFRAEYLDPNPITATSAYNYQFNDNRFNNSIRSSLLQNFSFSLSDNHLIEFRNLFNINSSNRTVERNGPHFYSGSEPDTLLSYALEFNQRLAYMGQIAGKSTFNEKNTEINWVYGYSYTTKDQPDMKRLLLVKQLDENTGERKYRFSFTNALPLPERGGRFYIYSFENIHNFSLGISQNIILGSRTFSIKTGAYIEQRTRTFDARNIGIIIKGASQLNLFSSFDSLFQDKNFFFPGGLSYNENTVSSNHYKASTQSIAPYIGIKIPITNRLNTYSGIRYENYNRIISDFQKNKDLVPDIKYASNDVYLSTNITYSLNDNSLLRFSYGNTVNRPEFREISEFYYKDFDLNAGVWGNDTLIDCSIQNYDLRYELYPSNEEIVSIALFYKKFNNPIEILLIETGNQPEYKPFNTKQAYSQGIEIDIRKSFENLGTKNNILQYLKNFTLILNTSLIKSLVDTDFQDAREKQREMMGQSPYIINTGIYYISKNHTLSLSLLYNRVGRRLFAIGTKNTPHTWELARNAVDITLSKGLGKGFEVKLGIKDLLNEPIQRVQYEEVTHQSTSKKVKITQTTLKYKPGTQVSIGLSAKF